MTAPRIRRKPLRPLRPRLSTPGESATLVLELTRSLARDLEGQVDLLVGSDAICAAHTLGMLHAALALLDEVRETIMAHGGAQSTGRTT